MLEAARQAAGMVVGDHLPVVRGPVLHGLLGGSLLGRAAHGRDERNFCLKGSGAWYAKAGSRALH